MFAIHYYKGRQLAAIEGPAPSRAEAQAYLDARAHYLDLTPRILSMNALRGPAPGSAPPALGCGAILDGTGADEAGAGRVQANPR